MDPVFGFPKLVRFSWSTSENALEKEAYHVEWEDIKEENGAPTNNTSITSFFKVFQKTDRKAMKAKHKFFSDRCLQTVTEF